MFRSEPFLSGGLDSGAIVALMSLESTEAVRTFCIGYGGHVGAHLDERTYARDVSVKYGTRHSEYEIETDVEGVSSEIVKSFDEPFADPGAIPSYYVCKIARQNVTVALSGLGGDEVFGGYERYLGFKFSSLFDRIPVFLRREIITQIVEKIPERSDGHYTVNHIKRFTRAANLAEDERYFGFINRFGRYSGESLFADPKKYRENIDNCKKLVLGHFQVIKRSRTSGQGLLLRHQNLFARGYPDLYRPDEHVAFPGGPGAFLDHKLVEFCATIPHQMKIRLWKKKTYFQKSFEGSFAR